MTSSDRASTGYARRFLWLALFILVAIAAYTGVWYYIAGQVRIAALNTIAAIESGGGTASCDNIDVRGYPFRIGLFCDGVAYADPGGGAAVTAGAFRSAAQIYEPTRIVGELDSPVEIAAPGYPALGLAWSSMQASVDLAAPLPSRFSLQGRDVSASLPGEGAEPVLAARDAEAHMRTRERDLDLAFSFGGLAVAGDGERPLLAGRGDATILGGVALAEAPETGLRGYSGEIRELTLGADSGPEAAVSLAGPLAFDEAGLIDADLTLTARNPAAIAALLGSMFPEMRERIETGFAGLAMLGDAPSLPLTIRRGRARIGFVTLGDIPPL